MGGEMELQLHCTLLVVLMIRITVTHTVL